MMSSDSFDHCKWHLKSWGRRGTRHSLDVRNTSVVRKLEDLRSGHVCDGAIGSRGGRRVRTDQACSRGAHVQRLMHASGARLDSDIVGPCH